MNTKTLSQTITLSLALALAGIASAADLGDDMTTIATQYRAFNQAQTPAAATQALDTMKAAALDARSETPDKLDGQPANSAPMRDYRAGIDALITQIDKVKALAHAGQLAQAKTAGKKLGEIRDENHKKFR